MKIIAAILTAAVLAFSIDLGDEEVYRSAALMTGGNPTQGRDLVEHYGCGSCHTISGVHGAIGLVGPPLDRIASRTYIAGVLENTPANMMRWIENPPAVDDKTAMPNLHLSKSEVRDVAAFVYTLR
jgi:mono/diheme cytochrome c family protein